MAMTPSPGPQPPPSIVTRAIGGDEIVDRSACNLALFCRTTNAPPQYSRCRISLIRAMRRTIEHFANRKRRDHAVVTAAAEQRVERSARILKTGQRNQEWPVLKVLAFPSFRSTGSVANSPVDLTLTTDRAFFAIPAWGLALAGKLIGVLSGIRSFLARTA